MDSLIAMPHSSCISHRGSGGMEILSDCSAIGRSPFPNLRRHLSKCSMDLHRPVLMSSLSSIRVKNLKRGFFFIDAAVIWTLEPLGMTMYTYIYITHIYIYIYNTYL